MDTIEIFGSVIKLVDLAAQIAEFVNKNSATTGNWANSATTGEAVAAALGINSRAKATVGGICVCDWVYDDAAQKWCLNNIYSAMVGGKILDITIEPDTWYWFENGKLHNEKE